MIRPVARANVICMAVAMAAGPAAVKEFDLAAAAKTAPIRTLR